MHILSIQAFPSAPPAPSRATPAQGLREQATVNPLLSRQDSTPLNDFFKIPQIPCTLPVRDVYPHSLAHLGYCDISEWHVRSTYALVISCINASPN